MNAKAIQVLIYCECDENDIYSKNKDGKTALYVCCEKGLEDFVNILLENDADINEPDDNGVSPLIMAIQKNYCSIVEMLLKYNESLGSSDSNENFKSEGSKISSGPTSRLDISEAQCNKIESNPKRNYPRKLARDGTFAYPTKGGSALKSSPSISINDSIEISGIAKGGSSRRFDILDNIDNLIAKPALALFGDNSCSVLDVNYCDNSGKTALIHACEGGTVGIIKQLLTYGADVTARTPGGDSCLVIAAKLGNTEVASIILNHIKESGRSNVAGSNTSMRKISVGRIVKNFNASNNMQEVEIDSTISEFVNMRNDLECTALMYSCENDNVNMLDLLFSNQAEIRWRNKASARNALMLACEKGHLQIVKYLVEKCQCKLNQKDKGGNTPLILSCLANKINVVEFLLQQTTINTDTVNSDGLSAFMVVCAYGYIDIVRLMIEYNYRNPPKDSQDVSHSMSPPLMIACSRGQMEVVCVLIDEGEVNCNELDYRMVASPLMRAAEHGHLEIVKALVSRGADIHTSNKRGFTPLMFACSEGHIDIVQYLIDEGASVNAKSNSKSTAATAACKHGYYDIFLLLVAHRADVDCVDDFGWTLLMHASANGHFHILCSLLSLGCNINLANKEGKTALMLACETDRDDVVQLLIQNRADVNSIDISGKSALHFACIHGKLSNALLLIQHKALYFRCYNKVTPMSYARHHGHFEVSTALEHKFGFRTILKKHDASTISSVLDKFQIVFAVLVSYFDVATDILSFILFYKQKKYKFFVLGVLFNVVPMCISISLQDGLGTMLLAASQLIVIREAIYSILGRIETPMMTSLLILESVLEACPSALLQLFFLLNNWLSEEESGLVHNTSSKILLLSIIVSIMSTSKSLSLYLTTEEERLLLPIKSVFSCCFSMIRSEDPNILNIVKKLSALEVLYCYHVAEEIFRNTSLCCLYLALGGFGLVFVVCSFLVRGVIAIWIYQAEDIFDCEHFRDYMKIFLRIGLSLVTDCIWNDYFNLTISMHIVTMCEAIIYFSLLVASSNYGDNYPHRNIHRVGYLITISVAAFFFKSFFYWRGYHHVHLEEHKDIRIYPVFVTKSKEEGILADSEPDFERDISTSQVNKNEKMKKQRSDIQPLKAGDTQFYFDVAQLNLTSTEEELWSNMQYVLRKKKGDSDAVISQMCSSTSSRDLYLSFLQFQSECINAKLVDVSDTINVKPSAISGRVTRTPLKKIYSKFVAYQQSLRLTNQDGLNYLDWKLFIQAMYFASRCK